MECVASVKLTCNDEQSSHIEKLFATGDKEISNGRAKYELLKNEKGLVFEIKAKDAVALRAMLTNITRTLSIYEKSKSIQ